MRTRILCTEVIQLNKVGLMAFELIVPFQQPSALDRNVLGRSVLEMLAALVGSNPISYIFINLVNYGIKSRLF